MSNRDRIQIARERMAAIKPHLVAKVQTGERGQLLLFPGHMAQTRTHSWRYQGTDQRFRNERHFLCAVCGELMIRVGEACLYGVARLTTEPECRRQK
ncbi:MAG: hypothetical protein JNM40_22340 [Myxococcales bacterium]|nr:hypothetical protein [Myxococcales bacterium]